MHNLLISILPTWCRLWSDAVLSITWFFGVLWCVEEDWRQELEEACDDAEEVMVSQDTRRGTSQLLWSKLLLEVPYTFWTYVV